VGRLFYAFVFDFLCEEWMKKSKERMQIAKNTTTGLHYVGREHEECICGSIPAPEFTVTAPTGDKANRFWLLFNRSMADVLRRSDKVHNPKTLL
jgi:hypothetical protein